MKIFFNGFIAQAFISSLPTVLVVACLPLASKKLEMSIGDLGLLYFLVRIGMIVGGKLAPLILKVARPRFVSSGIELLGAVMTLGMLLSHHHKLFRMFALFLLLKGVCIGCLLLTRVTWLKWLHDDLVGRRVLITLSTISQGFYGVAGLLLLLGVSDSQLPTLYIVDVLTSLVGSFVFLNLSDPPNTYNDSSRFGFSWLKIMVSTKYRYLLVADLTLATAMAGTNIFLVKAGNQILSEFGGYASVLLIYSGAYFAAGYIVQRYFATSLGTKFDRSVLFFAPGLLLAIFCMLLRSEIVGTLGIILLFLLYPMLLLSFEGMWFAMLSKEESASIISFRIVFLQLIWSLGEIVYGLVGETDLWIRAISLVICTYFVWHFTYQTRKI